MVEYNREGGFPGTRIGRYIKQVLQMLTSNCIAKFAFINTRYTNTPHIDINLNAYVVVPSPAPSFTLLATSLTIVF